MKFCNFNFSLNITRVCYLHDDINSARLIHNIESRDIDVYPDDDIILIKPNRPNIDFIKSITAYGAGTTTVGLNKNDAQRLNSIARFKHKTKRTKPFTKYASLDDMKERALSIFREAGFKSDESAEEFFPVMETIDTWLNRCDQSLQHMMAKYAVSYEKASSKGNCGITRNCRNIYTIDCDESIDYPTLVSIMTFQEDIPHWHLSDQVFEGISNIGKLVRRIFDLTGSLPHIVYNSESSHFQLQYLMDKPIYVTEDVSVALYKNTSAASRDTAYMNEHKKDWRSVFDRSFNSIYTDSPYKVRDLYTIIDEEYKTKKKIIIALLSADGDLKYVDQIDSSIKKGGLKHRLLDKIASGKFVRAVDLGIKMFELAKNSKLLVYTPEYYLYGNAHRNLEYINTGDYKFVDANYNYCANKSLCIGTDYSEVFDTDRHDTVLSRYQIVYDKERKSFSIQPFNLLKQSAWQYAEEYAINTKFVSFIGSLESASQLFEDDITDKFKSFVSTHTFVMDKNVSIAECNKAFQDKNKYPSKAHVSQDTDDDDMYDKNMEDISNKCSQCISQCDIACNNTPDNIDAISIKYTGMPYKDIFIHHVRKIEEDALNCRSVSRHTFDHTSGLSLFYKAISYNTEFCTMCKKYNKTLATSESTENSIYEMNALISYLFNDIVNNVYGNVLPGTTHTDKYEHKFDIRRQIVRVDPKCFDIYATKHAEDTRGVINGSFATSLWSGSTKLEIIPNMFSVLPAYIYSERKLQERIDAEEGGPSNKYYKRSDKTLYRKAWISLLEDAFNPKTPTETALMKISTLYKNVSYVKKGKTCNGVKHITRRELEESGVSYYMKKDKHIVEYCLETTSHFRVKGDKYGNINRYISSLEYFNDFLKDMLSSDRWSAVIKDDSIEPSLEEDIKSSCLGDTGKKCKVKDKDIILSQVKTYRYFTKMYTHIKATLKAVDSPSEEEHIVRLQEITHELYATLRTFLTGLYNILQSYNNTEYLPVCKNIDDIVEITEVNVEEAIESMINSIETFYNTADLFSDICSIRDFISSIEQGDS